MRVQDKLVDIFHMGRDFVSILRGTDYFHLPDHLGRHFADGRSYYIDFRAKAEWNGPCVEEVPVLYIPSLDRDVFFPGMVLQYGLGCIDRHLETGKPLYATRVGDVARWVVRHAATDGSFDNLSRELNGDPGVEFVSNNSAMTQGELVSFAVRALDHALVPDGLRTPLEALVHRAAANLVAPVDKGGGTLYRGDSVYLLEYCRRDPYVVLNGWVFALFGLWDYVQRHPAALGPRQTLDQSLATLARDLDSFLLPDNWSLYDNAGRRASATYQYTHINQMDALARLTGNEAFARCTARLRSGYTRFNRTKYTVVKAVDKLRDKRRYTNARRTQEATP